MLECHWFHLVYRYMRVPGRDIPRIQPSGEVETQPVTERRLLKRAGALELPLFQDLLDAGSEQVLRRPYDEWWKES